MAATIYDVARRAGVSVATVSNAFNAPGKVRAETLARVRDAVDELGFVPKSEAVDRARRATGRIGVVAPFMTYPSFLVRLRGVVEALRALPYEVVIYDQPSLAVREDYLSSLPVTRRLDGLLVMALPFDDRVAARLMDHRLETVVLEFERPGFSSVVIDNIAGGRMAARHLLSRGHRRVAVMTELVASEAIVHAGQGRLVGFREALAAEGVSLPESQIAYIPHDAEQARRQTLAFLALPDRPTAIFAHSDIQAAGVLKAARERGVRVPEDLAVIGFDDLELADYLGLTTIRQPLTESGEVAVDLLLGRLRDTTSSPRRVELPLTLIERGTT